MSSTKPLAFLALLGATLVAGWLWFDTLLRVAANVALGSMPVVVTDLQGLRISANVLALERVELVLAASGQQLILEDLALRYRRDSLLALPVPETLRLGVATLQAAGVDQVQPTVPAPASGTGSTTPAALLDLLRSFPLQAVTLDTVRLPLWQEALSLQLQASAGALDVVLRSDRRQITGSFRQAAAAEPAQFTFVVNDGSGTSGTLELALVPGPDAASVGGSGSFALAGPWQGQPYSLAAALEVPACAIDAYADCSLHFDGRASLAAYAVDAETMASGLAFSGAGTVALATTALQVVLEPGFVLDVASLESADLQLADVALSGASALSLQGDLATAALQLEAAAVSGTVGRARAGEWTLATAFDLRGLIFVSSPAPEASLQLATTGLVLSGPQAWLPAFDIDAALLLEDGQLTFSTPLRLRAATDSAIRVEGSHDLASGAGAARVTLPPAELAGEGNALSARLGAWPWDADLLGGTLAAQADLQWRSGMTTVVTGSASATLADVAGFHGSSFFRGLSAALEAEIDTAAALPVSTPPLALSLAELDVGLPLRNLVLALQLERQTESLVIASLYGELLDGSISASDQRFRIGSETNTMTLQFDGFRLERLLELAEYEGVEATGAVSGEVPVVFSADGIEVAAGRLFAVQPGGTIRYLGAAGNGQGNAALDIMNRALSNYRFETLESSIDYSPDGELVLSMQLQGRNPDMDNGRQVNLNLNLSDNIPALLRSLQAGRAIEDFLEGQYQ